MSMDATQAPTAEEYEEYLPQWELETPFEQRYEFTDETPTEEADVWPTAGLETPFISEYGEAGGETSLEGEAFRELLFDLYDTEMDRVIGEVVQEGAAAVAEQATLMGEASSEAASERFLENWIEPVREYATNMLDGIAEGFENLDAGSLTESEIDRVFETFEPEGTGLEQYFEDFLKSLWNKAKKVAAGAVAIAKKGISMIPGLSGILGRLRALVQPLLHRVLRMAMDKLPPQLRPVATQLARRIIPGFRGEIGEEESLEEAPAVPDVGTVQRELDQAVASLLVAGDETEQEAVLAQQLFEGERADGMSISEYHDARERFVDQLERGEDPRQALEQFIPAVMAIMPIARVALRLVGRPRVVGFLAGYLAQLIQRYIGADPARQLSRAVVDAGLRTIGLEVAQEDTQRLAPEVVAGTVEDTVRRVAELDETTLENAHLLEAAVNEAFQEAAAENFPSSELIPEVQEAAQVRAAWVAMPLRGRRKFYKKFTRVFDVEITPQMAQSVTSFGGKTLAALLKDRLGVVPPVRARMHLYQVLPGGWPSRIARLERIAVGGRGRGGWMQLHPLTPQAAGILLQHPRLGRAQSGTYLSTRSRPALGQRLYYLEIAGARPAAARRSSELNLALDFAGDQARAFIYLSEADAQELAAKIRRRELTSVITQAKRIYAGSIEAALGGDVHRHVKIRHEALDQEEFLGSGLKRLPKVALDLLKAKFGEWLGQALGDFFQARGADFVRAAEDPADGVTIVVTLKSPPGFPLVRKLLGGQPMSPTDIASPAAMFRGSPTFDVQAVAGFRFD